MIVEDDAVLMSVYVRNSQELDGVRLYLAWDGAQAIDLLQRVQPDLLMTNIHMPKVDGLQLLEHVQKQHHSYPRIVVSNLSHPEFHRRAKELGAVAYLDKETTTIRKLKPLILKYLFTDGRSAVSKSRRRIGSHRR